MLGKINKYIYIYITKKITYFIWNDVSFTNVWMLKFPLKRKQSFCKKYYMNTIQSNELAETWWRIYVYKFKFKCLFFLRSCKWNGQKKSGVFRVVAVSFSSQCPGASLFQIMTWRLFSTKLLLEPKLTLTHSLLNQCWLIDWKIDS